jgi:hypothetical protein
MSFASPFRLFTQLEIGEPLTAPPCCLLQPPLIQSDGIDGIDGIDGMNFAHSLQPVQ